MKSKRKVSLNKLKSNLYKVYNQASPEERDQGLYWYQTAHDDAMQVAVKYGLSADTVAGVIAALSPGLQWGLNIAHARELIGAHMACKPLPMVGVYGKRNVSKAIAIIDGSKALDVLPLTGPKTRAFFSNIARPLVSEDVTIDRHAKCAAYYMLKDRDKFSLVRVAEYKQLARAYSEVANEAGLLPNQLQAIVWVVWKRLVSQVVPF